MKIPVKNMVLIVFVLLYRAGLMPQYIMAQLLCDIFCPICLVKDSMDWKSWFISASVVEVYIVRDHFYWEFQKIPLLYPYSNSKIPWRRQ